MIAGQWKTTGRKVLGMTTGTLPGIRAAGPKKWDFTTSFSNCSSRSQEWEDQDKPCLVNAFLHSFVGYRSNFYHSPWIDEIFLLRHPQQKCVSPAYDVSQPFNKNTIFSDQNIIIIPPRWSTTKLLAFRILWFQRQRHGLEMVDLGPSSWSLRGPKSVEFLTPENRDILKKATIIKIPKKNMFFWWLLLLVSEGYIITLHILVIRILDVVYYFRMIYGVFIHIGLMTCLTHGV